MSASQELINKYQKIMDTIGDTAVELMKENVYGKNGVEKETGNLRNSIKAKPISEGVYDVGPEGYSDKYPYARVVRYGRGGIRPKNAPYLHFYWARADKWMKTDYVFPWYPDSDFIQDTKMAVYGYLATLFR